MKKILLGCLAVFLFAASTYAGELYVNDDRLPELAKNQKAILYFHADWCPYCKKFRPTWDAVVNDPANQALATFVRINIDTAKTLKGRFKVQGVPMLVRYCSCEEEFIGDPENPFVLDADKESYRPWNPEELLRFIKEGVTPP